MADKNKEDKTPAPKDRNGQIYDMHVRGISPAVIAEEHDLDSLEVLAIIQEVQAQKSK